MKKIKHIILFIMITGLTFVMPVILVSADEISGEETLENIIQALESSVQNTGAYTAQCEITASVSRYEAEALENREEELSEISEEAKALAEIRQKAVEIKEERISENDGDCPEIQESLDEYTRMLEEDEEICINAQMELTEVTALRQELLEEAEIIEDFTKNDDVAAMEAAAYKELEQIEAMKEEDDSSWEENSDEGLCWPLPSGYGPECISSGYGSRVHPITGEYNSFHAGLDIAAPSGTPIYACASGVVITHQYDSSAGNWTIIDHENGMMTEYMHQEYLGGVYVGEEVEKGQWIGSVGSTGASTGSHLHVGVILTNEDGESSSRVDPAPYLGVY